MRENERAFRGPTPRSPALLKSTSMKTKRQKPGFLPALRGRLTPPPRQGRLDSVLILLLTVLISAEPYYPYRWLPWLFVPLIPALAVGWARRSVYVAHAAWIILVFFLVGQFPRLYGYWPLPILLILAAYGLPVMAVPRLRAGLGWVKWGQPDALTWGLTAVFAALSALGVTAWRFLAHPDLAAFRQFVPAGVPHWLLPIGIVLYAALNALYEEVIWRGVLMQSLEAAAGPGTGVVLLQAAGFGFWHFHGFPGGWLGVGLAAVFALFMGLLRHRSRGLLAPWLAHLAADVTIYILVTLMVLTS